MRKILVPVLLVAACLVALTPSGAPAAQGSGLVAKPAMVDFHSKHVGTENYRGTKITNRTGAAVRLVVTAGLPDDFGFGLMPGSDCPVFSPGEVLAPGDSCDAVVRFSPTEGFLGWPAVGELVAIATNPVTGEPVDELHVPVYGKAVL